MAKQKIDDPSFIEFINLPLIKEVDHPEIEGAGYSILPSESRLIYMVFFKGCLDKLLLEGNLPPKQVSNIKMLIENFDNHSLTSLKPIMTAWTIIRSVVKNLIKKSSFREGDYLNFGRSVFDLGQDLRPMLCWKDNGYKIDLMPYYANKDPNEPHINPPKIQELATFFAKELIQFLTDHFKPGTFGYCNLDGCNRIIITTNGRKYCCGRHRGKAFKEKEKESSEKAEYRRIRGNLSKKYYRYESRKLTVGEFVRKTWPPDSQHLYNRFARDAK